MLLANFSSIINTNDKCVIHCNIANLSRKIGLIHFQVGNKTLHATLHYRINVRGVGGIGNW